MTTVYCTSPFVPPQLVAACGLAPCRLAPTADVDARREGACSFMSAWLDTLEQKQAAAEPFVCVFTSACDQMRRAFDLFDAQHPGRAFLLNMPCTASENALAYCAGELRRLQDFLCRISEQQQPDWTKAVTPRAQIAFAHEHTLRIAVTGESTAGPVLTALQSVAARFGADILDLTENALAPDVTDLQRSADPLEYIARACLAAPAIWKRPNDVFYQWLSGRTNDHGVSGVIVLRHSFCDLWRTAKPEMTSRLSLPVLELDLDGGPRLTEWAVSRIEAFLETLQ